MSVALAEAPVTGTDIAVQVQHEPAIVLLDAGKRDDLFDHIQREIDAFEPDLTTTKGRDAIKALAYKITRTKTAIDAAGKTLNEEARAKINVVDAARRVARDRLDQLAEDVRRPLTEWEDAEKARVAECEATIARIASAGTVTLDDTAASVRERGAEIWSIEISADRFGSLADRATTAKAHTVDLLKTALARLTKEEADRVELERLRAEAAQRDERERQEREAQEAEERAANEAREAEARRVAAEQAEAERVARIEREATERAQREAEAAARAEQERRDREHADALAAERRRAEEAERAAQAERDRIASEEAARQREAEQAAAAQAKRDADQKHRTKVKTAAKQALITCGADEETARKIVVAILASEIPNVSLRF
ncbi:MAG: hypothetical protein PGN16_04370 [Sphingomonas phyllosphaerae]|uniref:hypothetical protein n=1 Tax=Sphingomonas phyllosphaerae TaxID=257003 RepID=UPI002FF4437C